MPLTKAHEHGIFDPMTGSLVRVPGNGNLLTPKVCERKVSIFDGRLRYDLKLAYKRMDEVQRGAGAMPARWWSARSISRRSPASSPRAPPSNTSSEQRDMEVWLAPIAGTRVLVPFRAQAPTPIGQAVLEADQFVATAAPTRASLKRAHTE